MHAPALLESPLRCAAGAEPHASYACGAPGLRSIHVQPSRCCSALSRRVHACMCPQWWRCHTGATTRRCGRPPARLEARCVLAIVASKLFLVSRPQCEQACVLPYHGDRSFLAILRLMAAPQLHRSSSPELLGNMNGRSTLFETIQLRIVALAQGSAQSPHIDPCSSRHGSFTRLGLGELNGTSGRAMLLSLSLGRP